jgi:hypothetical protein
MRTLFLLQVAPVSPAAMAHDSSASSRCCLLPWLKLPNQALKRVKFWQEHGQHADTSRGSDQHDTRFRRTM